MEGAEYDRDRDLGCDTGLLNSAELKACVARKTNRYDFPDREKVNSSYTHSLKKLIAVAELDAAREEYAERDTEFRLNWGLVQEWSEQSRYQFSPREDAAALLAAVSDRKHGVIGWIKRYW